VESGCGFHLLERPDEWVSYITPCWLTSIWDFISKNKIMIKVASAWLSLASQEHVILWMPFNSWAYITTSNNLTLMQLGYTYR
jgi:hypothetical protein